MKAIKIKGLRNAVSAIKNTWAPYIRVYIDTDINKLVVYEYSNCNSWNQASYLIEVYKTYTPASIFRAPAPTMKELRSAIENALDYWDIEGYEF